jgi:NhaA family Na+:H+ antiporter
VTPDLVLAAALVVASAALVGIPAFRRHAFTNFLLDHDILFLSGAAVALVWANVAGASYEQAAPPLRRAINDVAMTLFFAVAAKEIREALSPGGALASLRQAALPLAATLGGMLGPALVYLLVAWRLGKPELNAGWAVPCATDVAFAYLAARLVFGAKHPAIPFLLLLSIADDAGGLLILAFFYPHGPLALWPWSLVLGAIALTLILRRLGVTRWWLHLGAAGVLAWFGLDRAGLHPALALVPVVLFMPPGESLEDMERALAAPVACVLGGFALVNAGVPFGHVGAASLCVLLGLLAGKPLGIGLATLLATRVGLRLPEGMRAREVFVLGVAAAIGFTVALFVATVAFKPGDAALDAAKMGALGSVVAAPLAWVLGKALRVSGT